MTRLLFFADLHIGDFREFNTNGNRLKRCLDALESVFECAIAKKCDAIIDCGDLLEEKNHIDFRAYNPVIDLFEQYYGDWFSKTPPMFSLVGNHNMPGPTAEESSNLRPLARYITVVDTPQLVEVGNVLLGFIPYRRAVEDWIKNYQHISTDAAARDNVQMKILVGHQELRGAVTGTHRYVAGDSGVDPFQLTNSPWTWNIFGHYHKFQYLAHNVFYCGATLQQEFGEEGNPQGFWIFDSTVNQWEWVAIDFPCFFTIDDPAIAAHNPYHYYRLKTQNPIQAKEVVDQMPVANVRVMSMPVIDQTTRLNIDAINDTGALVDAYLKAKVPQHLHGKVREFIRSLA